MNKETKNELKKITVWGVILGICMGYGYFFVWRDYLTVNDRDFFYETCREVPKYFNYHPKMEEFRHFLDINDIEERKLTYHCTGIPKGFRCSSGGCCYTIYTHQLKLEKVYSMVEFLYLLETFKKEKVWYDHEGHFIHYKNVGYLFEYEREYSFIHKDVEYTWTIREVYSLGDLRSILDGWVLYNLK